MTTAAPSLARPKPVLRGVSHEIAFYCSLLAGVLLVRWAPTTRAAVACSIYSATLSSLFGVSGLYHRPMWSPARRRFMQRLDHAAIFLLIAGTYTPIFALSNPDAGNAALWTVWIGAGLGVAKSMIWSHAPKPVTAAVCLIVGWAAAYHVIRLAPFMPTAAIWLLVGGGVVYSTGAIVYALRRPDPWPRVFGYHEIFHALVIIAAMMNYGCVVLVVNAAM